MQLGHPVFQDDLALGVGVVDDGLDLLVDAAGHLLGVGPGLGHGPADEHLVVAGIVDHGAQPLAHAVLGDHLPGDVGGPFQVVGGAGGDVAQHHLLGHTAAQTHRDGLLQLLLGAVGPVLLRQ